MGHNNLFEYASDSKEVYQVMQSHMKRDGRFVSLGIIGATICFGMALKLGATDGWPWLIGGLAVALIGLTYFIDSSNRNFYLHMIDWIESTRGKSTSEAE